MTDAGRAALRERTPITLTKQIEKPAAKTKQRAGEIECDETLFALLRGVRRTLADERNVPAYVIFSDVALREMARSYPTTPAEFRRIPGVGEQKLKDFADAFLAAIIDYLKTNPRVNFAPAHAPAAAPPGIERQRSGNAAPFPRRRIDRRDRAGARLCPQHDPEPSRAGGGSGRAAHG